MNRAAIAKQIARLQAQLETMDDHIVPATVDIPAGSFIMGSSGYRLDQPPRWRLLSDGGFRLAKDQ